MLQRAASARASAGPLSGADSPEGHAQEHEHRELQEENLRLLRETTRLRSDLNASEQERVAICRALGLEQRPLEQARGGVGAGPGVAEAAALQGKDRVAAQLRVLAAQRDSLARREAGVSRREADTQKDQVRSLRGGREGKLAAHAVPLARGLPAPYPSWQSPPCAQELVSKYHEWLKSLPLATEDDRKSCVRPGSTSPPPQRRCCGMPRGTHWTGSATHKRVVHTLTASLVPHPTLPASPCGSAWPSWSGAC